MRLLCPAKINLHLRVGPLRGDGFHPLLSWFCTTGLFDTLMLERGERTAGTEGSQITLRCDQEDLPVDRRNLVVKVGEAWAVESRRFLPAMLFPVNADLRKRIPAGAGLGGGSSDGARMLLGLNALWTCGRPADELSAFAGRFGSDLSFFCFGPSSICKGRGEIVEPTDRPRPCWVMLILPSIHMPTADVYRRFDAMKLGRDEDIANEPDWRAWAKLNARDLLELLVNDLEPSAFAVNPTLSALRAELQMSLNRPVRMSGSGSSLFTLYDDAEEAVSSKTKLEAAQNLRIEVVELAPDLVDDINANRS